jgi:drug/metabolite transporter (DMT)-like permease
MSFRREQIVFLVGSSVLHLAYFLILQRGYQIGDLSVVYPLARGTGPTFSVLGAVLLFAERPTALALGGGAMIIVGVVMMAGSGRRRGNETESHGRFGKEVLFGIFTGVFIALYTLWDKQAVSRDHAIPPLILDYASSLLRVGVLLPVAIHKQSEIRVYINNHK